MNLESCSGQSMNPGVSLQAGSFRTDRQTKLGNIFTKLKCNVFLTGKPGMLQFMGSQRVRDN